MHKTVGYLGWSLTKVRSKKIEKTGIYLVKGTQNNQFNDGKTTCFFFNRELGSLIYQPSEWQHVVEVVDGLFYHLYNEDMSLFRYPIFRLVVGKQEQLN